MNKICAIILFSFLSVIVSAETIPDESLERNGAIDARVESFWSYLSNTYDRKGKDLDEYLNYIVNYYEHPNIRLIIGSERVGMLDFLQRYHNEILKNNNVTHIFKRYGDIVNYGEDYPNLYVIKGQLDRDILQNKEDCMIRPVDVEMVVYYNKDENKENKVKIYEINMIQELVKVYPETYYEFVLDIDPSTTKLDYNGGSVFFDVESKKRKVKHYPGFESKKSYGDYEQVKVKFNEGALKLQEKEFNKFYAEIRPNYRSSQQNFNVIFTQENGETKEVIITQSYRNVVHYSYDFFFSFKKAFQFDRSYYGKIWDMSVHYSPKYNVGLSVMFTPEESRFSFGGIIASNFDSFRGIDLGDEVSTWASVSTSTTTTIGPDWETSDVVNGYRKVSEKLNPEENDFSSIFDPYNEAKHYQSRTLIMANCGFHITNWLNISLGVGPIVYRDVYYMESLYDVMRTSYIPTQSGLPAIDDVYTYRRHSGSDKYYFKNPTKWGFGLRPAINLSIPLSDEISLPIGCGYVISTLDDCNSVDFSIGISFNY